MIKNARNAWKEKKIRLICEFIGFKNDRLNYKSKKCKKLYSKLTNESIKKFPTLYKFCKSDLNKFFLQLRKGIYLMRSIWIAGKDLMKIQYHLKKLFTAN